jgi:hypothetical protein
VLLAVVSILVSGACSSQDQPSSTPRTRAPSVSTEGPSSSTPATTPPSQDPEGFDFANAVIFPEITVDDIALTDTVALTMTSQGVIGRSLPDLKVVYTLPTPRGDFTDLEVDEAAGTGLVVATELTAGVGTQGGTDTYTVTEFALSDGRVIRAANVDLKQDTRAGDTGTTARIVGLVGDHVILDSRPDTVAPDDIVGDAAARHTTVVADLSNPADVWSTRPAAVLTATEDVVVVRTGTATRPGEVEALAVDGGGLLWSALPDTKSARLVGVDGETVVITRSEQPTDRSTVVRLSLQDGTVRGTRPTFSWVWTCSETSHPIAVCNVLGRPVLIGWDLEAHKAAWRLPDRSRLAPQVSTVLRDRAYGLLAQHGVVLDALTGAELANDTGAAPSEVSVWGGLTILGDQAVFQPVLPG